ncbi:hypothetical protein Anapl_08760 [Anas platyrhynchos]|uniref:Uncharacterized protein n=1 Tax=Anas platyrhynchos TaxID=8839 RepID=R0JSG4_ANAPL|nr:hypothetical protein Anapl_08760 [Anas platyrhynchos]
MSTEKNALVLKRAMGMKRCSGTAEQMYPMSESTEGTVISLQMLGKKQETGANNMKSSVFGSKVATPDARLYIERSRGQEEGTDRNLILLTQKMKLARALQGSCWSLIALAASHSCLVSVENINSREE